MCGAGRAGGDRDLKTAEARLTWLVYIIGSAVGGRVSFNSNEDHDAMDGELVCRVLQLMQVGGEIMKKYFSCFLFAADGQQTQPRRL